MLRHPLFVMITDKDAIDQVRKILKNCSPAAKKAITALLTPSTLNIPPARTMKREDLPSTPEIQRLPPQIYDKSKETPLPPTEGNEWLNDWIKTK